MCRSPSLSGSTRSASVTIPTQRPSPSTTGTPGSSFSRSAFTTSSTPASGETVSGFESITSRTVTGATLAGEPGGKLVDHVAGHDVVGAVALAGGPPGANVRERPERGGLERAEPLGEQRADEPGEHVAGARRGER